MAEQIVDRAAIRSELGNLRDEDVYYLLGEAIEMLPLAKAQKLIKGHINLSQIRQDSQKPKNLLEEIKEFQQASLRGDYYQSFGVNSKNCNEKSKGTRAWIFEFNHLLNRCIAAAKKENKNEIREAIEICFGLLRQIDKCLDDVIFFADEGGSWQVGVDWSKALPAYFLCLSTTAQPDEYASQVVAIVDEFERHARDLHLDIASRMGSPSQRKVLKSLLNH